MRATLQTGLAVVVITGWFLALLWLVVSVAQVAVAHTMVRECTATGRLVPAAQLNDPLGLACPR